LPDESFDYEDFVEREFGKKKVLPHGISWFWWLIAALVAVLVSFAFLSGMIGF